MNNIFMSLKLLKAKIAYNYAKLKALQLYRLKGMQQFILMTDDGRLLVMDKSVFYKLRKNKNMPNYIQPNMLPRLSVWYTQCFKHGKKLPSMPLNTANKRKLRYLQYIRNKA